MMVVHEDNDRPVEVSVIKKPLLEKKSYVIVKNHVKELTNTTTTRSKTKNTENVDIQHKNRQSSKTIDELPTTSSSSDVIINKSSVIDSNDLEELKTVYRKCKEVMKRIETRYGHLLDLDEPEHSRKRKKQYGDIGSSEEECRCQFNKKILFDDEGKQLTVDNKAERHICVKRRKPERNIIIEDQELPLPDSLQELGEMLHDPNIEKTHRNRILDKIRSLKQDYVNEIKFNKHILIEKLKSNPDEVLNFKGTNLSTLPGYS